MKDTLPHTLSGLWPGRQVLVFRSDSKVYGEETPKENIPGLLCPLIGPVR